MEQTTTSWSYISNDGAINGLWWQWQMERRLVGDNSVDDIHKQWGSTKEWDLSAYELCHTNAMGHLTFKMTQSIT